MSELTPTERQILSAMSDEYGVSIGTIGYTIAGPDASEASSYRMMDEVRQVLPYLSTKLLAREVIANDIALWIRTPAGTEALRETENV